MRVEDITLAAVGRLAGVTEQTVIRRYGSKEGLVTELVEGLNPEIQGERGDVPEGDVSGGAGGGAV